MRLIAALLILGLASPLLADELKVHRGLPYAEPKNERQTLDVYATPTGKAQPVVLWIHGGGWRKGDKSSVQKKPQAFVDKGFVFVSTNYRFVPQVTVKEMTSDIAKAIRWIHEHAKEYGGDPKSIFVMGHSAGAHLAALVCTDDRYLKAEGLSLSIIRGCVPVDVFRLADCNHPGVEFQRALPTAELPGAIVLAADAVLLHGRIELKGEPAHPNLVRAVKSGDGLVEPPLAEVAPRADHVGEHVDVEKHDNHRTGEQDRLSSPPSSAPRKRRQVPP